MCSLEYITCFSCFDILIGLGEAYVDIVIVGGLALRLVTLIESGLESC